jgi:hypothetical protein
MCPQQIGYDPSRAMIHGMPEPSLLGFLPNHTPSFINFHFCHLGDRNDDRSWFPMEDGWIVEVLELRLFF